MIFNYISYTGFFRNNIFIDVSPSLKKTINHLQEDLLPPIGVSTKNLTLKPVSTNKALDLSYHVTPHKKDPMIKLKGDLKAQSYLMHHQLLKKPSIIYNKIFYYPWGFDKKPKQLPGSHIEWKNIDLHSTLW